MLPRIKSGQRVIVQPLTGETLVRRGDVVLVRVRGSVMLHLVSAIDGDRVQISNNRGHVNGWVRRSVIYGVALA